MLFGILLGLGSAFCSSLAYLVSRRYSVHHVEREADQPQWLGPLRLMVTTHVMLGVVCGGAYLVIRPTGEAQPPDWSWALSSCVFVALFYLIANTLVFFVLQRTEASRIAPLLGFKVVLLALVTHFILKDPLVEQQWVAVLLATAAAWVLGASGGRLPRTTVVLTVLACACYVSSDTFIGQMVPAWMPAGVDYEAAKTTDPLAVMTAALQGMALSYVWCGLVAVALLPIAKPWRATHWRGSAPYAGAWLLAMVCLYSCFALTNIVLGTILQSTRGLMSIFIGVLIYKLGHHHIESHAPLKVVIQRAIAAALMIVVGIAVLMSLVGLSPALGTFIAGV
ncbi:MAG: EamA family transporter, partial [Phycisphaeraceae bacterium]